MIEFIGAILFPIGVACFVVVRLETVTKQLRRAIEQARFQAEIEIRRAKRAEPDHTEPDKADAPPPRSYFDPDSNGIRNIRKEGL